MLARQRLRLKTNITIKGSPIQNSWRFTWLYCLQGLGEQKRTKYKINGTATSLGSYTKAYCCAIEHYWRPSQIVSSLVLQRQPASCQVLPNGSQANSRGPGIDRVRASAPTRPAAERVLPCRGSLLFARRPPALESNLPEPGAGDVPSRRPKQMHNRCCQALQVMIPQRDWTGLHDTSRTNCILFLRGVYGMYIVDILSSSRILVCCLHPSRLVTRILPLLPSRALLIPLTVPPPPPLPLCNGIPSFIPSDLLPLSHLFSLYTPLSPYHRVGLLPLPSPPLPSPVWCGPSCYALSSSAALARRPELAKQTAGRNDGTRKPFLRFPSSETGRRDPPRHQQASATKSPGCAARTSTSRAAASGPG